MAKRGPAKKKSDSPTGFISRRLRLLGKSLAVVFFILLGGLLFNLDRMGDFGIMLLKYKSLLPSPIPRFLPGGTAEQARALPQQELSGRIIEVHDGDTATLLDDGNKKYRIRFYGIDAPESKQSYGRNAGNALRDKILGANVRVLVVNVDNYGRAVGKVILGERYINLEMVNDGMAWYYASYARNEKELEAAEHYARSRKAGLWSESDPEAPWNWRRKNQKK